VTALCAREFIDLQIAFAQRVAELSEIPVEQVLIDYTNLYIRFGLGRSFDPAHPLWQAFLAGLSGPGSSADHAWAFYQRHGAPIEAPGVIAKAGCFSYARKGDLIRLHFEPHPHGPSPLALDQAEARRAELRNLFRQIRATQPPHLRVYGYSWLYNLPGYRRLFPPAYIATAAPGEPKFRHMPLWGQFLDRQGEVRQANAAAFRAALDRQTQMEGIELCFPFQALSCEAPVECFHAFYADAGHENGRPGHPGTAAITDLAGT